MLSAVQRGAGVADTDPVARLDVVGHVAIHDRRARQARLLGIERGRQFVVVDAHQLGRVLGVVAAVGDNRRHRLPNVADLAVSEDLDRGRADLRLGGLQPGRRRLLVEHQGVHLVADVRAGVDRDHTLRGQGLRGVDAHDAGVCERASHEGNFECAGQVEVGHISAGAGDQRQIFFAGYALADPGHEGAASRSAISSAARSTAAKIFT